MNIPDADYTCSLACNFCKNTRTDEHGFKSVVCKCGCTRNEVKVVARGEGAGNWLQVQCKRCKNTLYYNGA